MRRPLGALDDVENIDERLVLLVKLIREQTTVWRALELEENMNFNCKF